MCPETGAGLSYFSLSIISYFPFTSCLWDHEDELLSIYSVIVNFLGCIENINNCDQLIIMGPIIPADLIALSGFVRIETKEP